MPTYPLIKGKRVDWSSVELSLKLNDGAPVSPGRGITGLDWNISRSGAYVYGQGAKPVGQTRGQMSYSASVTLLKEEWQFVKQQFGDGYGEAAIDIVATWLDGGFESKVEIIGATILDEGESASAGGDAPEITLELLPADIVGDGVYFLATSQV